MKSPARERMKIDDFQSLGMIDLHLQSTETGDADRLLGADRRGGDTTCDFSV